MNKRVMRLCDDDDDDVDGDGDGDGNVWWLLNDFIYY